MWTQTVFDLEGRSDTIVAADVRKPEYIFFFQMEKFTAADIFFSNLLISGESGYTL